MSRQLEEQMPEERNALVEEIYRKKCGDSDKDWYDQCEEFDQGISPETLRKAGVGVKQVFDSKINSAFGKAADYIDRQKTRDLNSIINKTYRAEARSQLLRETIQHVAGKMKPLVVDSVEYAINEDEYDSENKSLVVVIGDLHFGARFHVEGLCNDVINHYDENVFDNRMKKLLSEQTKIILKENIRNVDVFLVGDLLDGMIRKNQLRNLEFGLVESTMKIAEYMSWWLTSLSKYSVVTVHSVNGNHSEIRPLGSKHREFEEENMEKIIMWYIEARTSCNDRLKIDAKCNKMNLVNVQGFNFLLVHGDGDRKIETITKDTINLYSMNIDYFICGHKHSEKSLGIGQTKSGNSVIIQTPSLCGMSEYSQNNGYGGKAGAIAMVIEKGYGRRCIYPIILS